MNIIQLQDRLKDFSQNQLVQEMQKPSGQVPQFLVLSELQRRKRLQQDLAQQQAPEPTTVAEDAVAAAGVPQGGVSAAAAAMAPKTDVVQNTGIASVAPQAMRRGGSVRKMADGGYLPAMTDPAIIAMANRMGMTVEQYLASLPPDEAAKITQQSGARATRDKMLATEPVGDGMTFPTQSDLNRRFADQNTPFVRQPSAPAPMGAPPAMPSMDAGITSIPLPPQLPPSAEELQARSNAELDQKEYGYAPGSDRRMTADEMAAAAAGPSAPLPAPPPSTAPSLSATVGETLSSLLPSGLNAGAAMGEAMRREAADTRGPAFETRGRNPAPPAPTVPAGAAAASTPPSAPGTAPATPGGTAPAAPGGAGGGMGGGMGASAGAPTSFESELLSMLKSKERAAEQDKWLALAQFGLQMMASDKPDFAGAVGEAGMAAIPAFTQSRDKAAEDRLALLGALEQARMARTRAAAVGGGGAGGAGGAFKPMPASVLSSLYDQLSDVNGQLAMLPPVAAGEPDPDAALRMQLQAAANTIQQQINLGMAQYGAAPTGGVPAGVVDLSD